MGRRIMIKSGGFAWEAQLSDNKTADALWEALPVEGRASRWGDEIYFPIPLKLDSEPGARDEVLIGELGYWPPGNAFCIFFGPTPASHESEPRAASPVNPVGAIIEPRVAELRKVSHGDRVIIERL